jgi:hypothetical protein
MGFSQIPNIGGDLQPAVALSVASFVVLAILAFAAEPLARRLALPHKKPWGARD